MCRYVAVAESESVEAAEEKVELVVNEEDIKEARKGITPSALKEVQFEVPKVQPLSSPFFHIKPVAPLLNGVQNGLLQHTACLQNQIWYM